MNEKNLHLKVDQIIGTYERPIRKSKNLNQQISEIAGKVENDRLTIKTTIHGGRVVPIAAVHRPTDNKAGSKSTMRNKSKDGQAALNNFITDYTTTQQPRKQSDIVR